MMLVSRQWREDAQERLAGYLSEEYSAEALNSDELIRADLFGDFEQVWRIEIGDNGHLPPLLLGVTAEFPAAPPRVIVQPADQWHLRIPHIESNGCVCILPSHASADQRHLEEVVDEIVAKAISTIEDGLSGSNRADFIREIESYWEPDTEERVGQIWFIGRPSPPSRIVHTIALRGITVVGDSERQCARWLENYRGRSRVKGSIGKGLFLYTQAEIYPDSFFKLNADVIRYVEDHHPLQLKNLASLATRKTRRIDVFLALASENGPALLASSLKNNIPCQDPSFPGQRAPTSRLSGFRDGKLSPRVFGHRFGKDPCTRRLVRRAYAEWIHTRGGGQGMEAIFEKSAVLIGGGSIGSEVAQMLCNAGLQNLTIVDHDILSMDNIGRHLLGAREVGKNKAQGLRDHLLGQFPHAKIDAVTKKWQEFVDDRGPERLFNADLVISLTGDWASDCSLNMEIRGRGGPPTVFGWTEPHGYAGHALFVGPRGGCLACGRDAFGEVRHRVTEWPTSQLQAVPACGGFFQPYGAVETGPIKSMIASLAIDCLRRKPLRSELRSWLGSRLMIEEQGGTIAADWLPFFENPAVIGQTIGRPWFPLETCPQCSPA